MTGFKACLVNLMPGNILHQAPIMYPMSPGRLRRGRGSSMSVPTSKTVFQKISTLLPDGSCHRKGTNCVFDWDSSITMAGAL